MATRTLIVDDSPTARAALRLALAGAPEIEVVGEAATGSEALVRLRELRPDIVTLDIFLRGESGLDVAAAIMSASPCPIVAVTAVDPTDPGLVFKAIQAGVLEVCAKLPSPRHPDYAAFRQGLIRTLTSLAQVPVVHRRRPRPPGTALPSSAAALEAGPPVRGAAPTTLIALGASTGGPPVLRELLRELGACPSPIAIVQHIVPDFLPGFARWLASETGRTVVLVERQEQPSPGVAYLAAVNHHLQLNARGQLVALQGPPVRHHRPSIDVLFESLVRLGARATAALLTGMGSDGARGLAALHAAGARTAVQSPDSCAVDGMPRAALERCPGARILDRAHLPAFLLNAPPACPP